MKIRAHSFMPWLLVKFLILTERPSIHLEFAGESLGRGLVAGSASAEREAVIRVTWMNRYSCEADEFFFNVNLNTEMELPRNRDTVLHFFEQIKKGFPDLRNFHTKENGDLVLEGDKDRSSYRWVAIEPNRLSAGHLNPEILDESYRHHEMVLDLAPPLLTISLLDCEALDVMFGFDFSYEGNHDEVVAEALGAGDAVEGILGIPRAKVINFEPSLTLALDESCQLQCRVSVETRTNAYQVRTKEFGDDQISVYFTVRQYWGAGPDMTFLDSFHRQRQIGEEILEQMVIPKIVRPLAHVITSR